MKRSCGLLVVWLHLAIVPTAAFGQSLQCGSIYSVQSGDSLSKIAQRVYGRTSAYQPIFDFNPGVMSDPNRLPAGVDLYLPCIGDTPGATAGAPLQAPAPLTPLPPSAAESLKILTGSEYPPYVDEDLPNGGFSVELVERALRTGKDVPNYRIDVINDWTSHLVPLLADGAYDLAFPWFRPDCSKRASLGESSVWRCDNLRFSEPLHDVVVAFYARAAEGGALGSAEDLKGLRICRPRGYFTHDLEAMGLVADSYERSSPVSPIDCFEQLIAGDVDVVTVNADTADRIVGELEAREQVLELVDLANVQTLHVVAMKSDPSARVNVLKVSQGIRQLKFDGEYRKIAATHLVE